MLARDTVDIRPLTPILGATIIPLLLSAPTLAQDADIPLTPSDRPDFSGTYGS